MAAKIFHDAFEAARTESRRRDQVAAVEAANSGIGASLLEAAHVQLTALKAENAALQIRAGELGDALAAAREALARAEAQAAMHRDHASQASAVAERERARADAEALAARGARELAGREREARVVAESKPPTIIREPAQVIAAPPVPAPPAPVLPEPPKKLRMRILGRVSDGGPLHGMISDVEWIPSD